MKFRVLSIIASYYVRSSVCLWRSHDVSSLGSIYRTLHVTTRELLKILHKIWY